MRQIKTPGLGSEQPGLSRNERTKLVVMTVALVFVVVAIWTSMYKARSYRGEAVDDLPETAGTELEEKAYEADIDEALVESLVNDADPADRVVLEREGVEALMAHARRMTQGSYRAMGAEELDATLIQAIVDDPGAHRARPFVARGWIDTFRTRRTGPEPEHSGRLILEDDSVVYFVALDVPDGSTIGDFIRMDGLFLKVFSDESSEKRGTWLEGPLLVGARAIRSYPALGEVTELDPRRFMEVRDDSVETGITLMPFNALWHLMAYARDLLPGAIDWAAVPELDSVSLRKIIEDGEPYRIQPFRIPVSRLQSITILRSGENPARIERYTEGWIGNATWKDVIHYKAPFEQRDVKWKDLVHARGFFFKNLAYEPMKGGIHVAPVFVLHSLERYDAPIDPTYMFIAYVIVGASVVLLVLFSFLLTRDRRRSQALQDKLVERRRARRRAEQAKSMA